MILNFSFSIKKTRITNANSNQEQSSFVISSCYTTQGNQTHGQHLDPSVEICKFVCMQIHSFSSQSLKNLSFVLNKDCTSQQWISTLYIFSSSCSACLLPRISTRLIFSSNVTKMHACEYVNCDCNIRINFIFQYWKLSLWKCILDLFIVKIHISMHTC
jgi:hypothetical protein